MTEFFTQLPDYLFYLGSATLLLYIGFKAFLAKISKTNDATNEQ